MGLSLSSSEINPEIQNNLTKDDLVFVNFVQLKQSEDCVVNPEQLNLLLGLNVPKYSKLEATTYPYLFCICSLVDIDKIDMEYKYEIGISALQRVSKKKFNSNHRAIISYKDYNDYELEFIDLSF